MTTQEIVAKLWNLCNVLRDDGITYHQYVTELTYILFLKMAKETDTEDAIPAAYRWDALKDRKGLDLKNYYKELLDRLGTDAEAQSSVYLLALVFVFLALAVLTKGGIGGGDIKLVAALGLWLGSDMLMTVVIAGIVLGGMAALIMLATGKRKKGDYFAYGPYFTISALLFTLL